MLFVPTTNATFCFSPLRLNKCDECPTDRRRARATTPKTVPPIDNITATSSTANSSGGCDTSPNKSPPPHPHDMSSRRILRTLNFASYRQNVVQLSRIQYGRVCTVPALTRNCLDLPDTSATGAKKKKKKNQPANATGIM